LAGSIGPRAWIGVPVRASAVQPRARRGAGRCDQSDLCLSLLLERGDRAGLAALRRRRAGWLLPVLALLLAVAFGFTDALLGLFRPEFVGPGRVALRLLAVAAALSMALALALTMLKFRRRHRPVLVGVGLAALLQAVLLALLVPRFGATGPPRPTLRRPRCSTAASPWWPAARRQRVRLPARRPGRRRRRSRPRWRRRG
jgi:hypothetical protein